MFSFIDNVWDKTATSQQGGRKGGGMMSSPVAMLRSAERQQPPLKPPPHLMDQMQREWRDKQYAQTVAPTQPVQGHPIHQQAPSHLPPPRMPMGPAGPRHSNLAFQIQKLQSMTERLAQAQAETRPKSATVPMDVILAILIVGFIIVIFLLFAILRKVNRATSLASYSQLIAPTLFRHHSPTL